MRLMKKEFFGETKEHKKAYLYTISSGDSEFVFTDYGAALVSWKINGLDIVLGYDTLLEYENGSGSFGATVGRCANRIADGKFTLNGIEYPLDKNDGNNTLHSGNSRTNKRVWEAAMKEDERSVTFTLLSPDGDQGFPGTLTLSVIYTVTEDGSLCIDYVGTCDKDTVLNPTNHSYFNLNGHASGSIEDQILTLYADSYTPLKPGGIPDGTICPVKGTALDFTAARRIGENIDSDEPQIVLCGGYDHNYVLYNGSDHTETSDGILHPLKKAARAASAESGLTMEVFTDLPGIQLYTGNGIHADTPGKENALYQPRSGFCLETQFFPNAINEPSFISPVLKAGDTFRSRTVYRVFR